MYWFEGVPRYVEGYIESKTHIYPGNKYLGSRNSDPNTLGALGIDRLRRGIGRSGYYPSGTRLVDERGTTRIYLVYCAQHLISTRDDPTRI